MHKIEMIKNNYIERIDKKSLWQDKAPLLTVLEIELTERCPNDCLHCFINLPVNDSAAKNKELSTDQVRDILEEAASLGCLQVKITGGEPLLREDFEDIYVFARKLGIKVLLLTNASLITPRTAELFTRIPPLKAIEVTVYGMKKESYEAVTKTPGSFDTAWKGISLLLENKIPFIVKGALLPPNEKEIDEFDAWAATVPGMDLPPAYSMFFNLCADRGKDKNRIIKQLRAAPVQGIKILAKRYPDYVKETKLFLSRFAAPPGEKLFNCNAGDQTGSVNAYGFFKPCLLLRAPETLYDLKKGTLKDALENAVPRVLQTEAGNPAYLKRCAKCFLKGLCEQCPAKAWLETGTLDAPLDYFCEITHAQARHLGLLKNKEMAWEVSSRDNWEKRLSTI